MRTASRRPRSQRAWRWRRSRRPVTPPSVRDEEEPAAIAASAAAPSAAPPAAGPATATTRTAVAALPREHGAGARAEQAPAPPGRAGGSARETGRIAQRADTWAATSVAPPRPSSSAATEAATSATASTSASAPNAPTRGSRRISSRRARLDVGADGVGDVGEAVLVQRAGDEGGGGDREQRRRQGREGEIGERPHAGGDAADEQADDGEPLRRPRSATASAGAGTGSRVRKASAVRRPPVDPAGRPPTRRARPRVTDGEAARSRPATTRTTRRRAARLRGVAREVEPEARRRGDRDRAEAGLLGRRRSAARRAGRGGRSTPARTIRSTSGRDRSRPSSAKAPWRCMTPAIQAPSPSSRTVPSAPRSAAVEVVARPRPSSIPAPRRARWAAIRLAISGSVGRAGGEVGARRPRPAARRPRSCRCAGRRGRA